MSFVHANTPCFFLRARNSAEMHSYFCRWRKAVEEFGQLMFRVLCRLALHRAVPCLREGAPLLPLLTTPNMCRATAAMLRIAQQHLPFSRCLRTGCNPSSTSVLATFLLLWLAACPSHKHMTGVVVHGPGTPETLPTNNHLSLPWWSCKFGTPTSANPAAQLTQLNYKTPTC